MELRQYWRILVRRRKVLRNTFLLAVLVALVTTAYSSYTSFWQAGTSIDVQVQPQPKSVTGSIVDPTQAAHQNTDQVVLAVSVYATTKEFLQALSTGLKPRGYAIDWQTLGQSLDVHTGKSHIIDFHWSSNDEGEAKNIVTVAANLLLAYVPVWQKDALPNSPPIRAFTFDPPSTQRLHFTKAISALGTKLAVGVVAGLVLAYLFEYLDVTIQDEADAQRWLGFPTLAVIPGADQKRRARSA
jgi:capsular polysaccharide biosynthesis protein